MRADSPVPIGNYQEPEVPLCSQSRLPHYSACTLPHVGADALRALRTLLAREQRRMRGEYEIRLKELERERLHAEQDKAQVSGSRRHLCQQLTALLECNLTLHV